MLPGLGKLLGNLGFPGGNDSTPKRPVPQQDGFIIPPLQAPGPVKLSLDLGKVPAVARGAAPLWGCPQRGVLGFLSVPGAGVLGGASPGLISDSAGTRESDFPSLVSLSFFTTTKKKKIGGWEKHLLSGRAM